MAETTLQPAPVTPVVVNIPSNAGGFGNFVKNASLVTLLVISCLSVGFGAAQWYTPETLKAALQPATSTEPVLHLPGELQVTVGEPLELRADTAGKRVIFMSLADEVRLRPLDPKAVWVYGTKAGVYKVTAWTAVGGVPTTNALCTVRVVDVESTTEQPAKPAKQ